MSERDRFSDEQMIGIFGFKPEDLVPEKDRAVDKNLATIYQQAQQIEQLKRELDEANAVADKLYNLAIEAGCCEEWMKVNFATSTDFLSKLKLEQQAKGIEDLLSKYDCVYSHNCIYQPVMLEHIKQLRQQAESSQLDSCSEE